MTIEKGGSWGRVAPTPADLLVADDEHSAARAVAGGAKYLALRSGDLLRAIGIAEGTPAPRVGEPSLQLPCDVLEVTCDHERTVALSSVVIGTTARPRVWVSLGGFLGTFNVSPRAHPNDGLLDALRFDGPVPIRQLLAIRRRMRLGAHLPHPSLSIERTADFRWCADDARGTPVRIDRRRRGRVGLVTLTVRADAYVLCAPVGR